MMEKILVLAARMVLGTIQLLPLWLVARLGRWGGGFVGLVDRRHFRVAVENLTHAFGQERSPEAIRSLARENFRRIGENFACAVKTMTMSPEGIRKVLTVEGLEKVGANKEEAKRSRIFVIGHFGNFELYSRADQFLEDVQFATTYRGLRQPALNAVLQDLRERSGCLYFERRTQAKALKTAMSQPGMILGLLADQHGGDRGLVLKLFGRDCSTNAAPAVFALRYECPLQTAFCFRVKPGRWRIEVGDEIPTHQDGKPREVGEIMTDVNREIEQAIRKDPANWFWVHNHWKPGKGRIAKEESSASPATD